MFFAICIDSTRDKHPKERASCRFSLVPATGLIEWPIQFECPTSSSACSFICALFNQEPAKVAASYSNHVSYGFYEKLYKTEIALRCSLSARLSRLLSVEKSPTSKVRKELQSGQEAEKCFTTIPASRLRSSTWSSPVFGCDQLTRILKIMMFAVRTDRLCCCC